ncbi:zinc ABC transporter substrate-binding protein [Sneathiella litorea]|uniref:High-affinity zinc uptake system protein ZnuA n=1 Tax=Sneathiella litorea TaxID=2606216 RepID=A0A6L8W419_9PROT|nr:zinc ABC transporter substrate-binding protein [Sneathiella litorea]MZR29846.1 zinc ABC transporter solute-binding protein [Sneathiella litorea]
MTRFLLRLVILFLIPTSAFASDSDAVVVTIKPLHSLVQGVMGETGDATLLITGIASPHGLSLKPSQVSRLQDAKVVFYIDDAFESFLKTALASLPEKVRKVSLSHAEGVELLERREGGTWEEDIHGHEHGHSHAHDDNDDHGTEADNLHLWLDPKNAIHITRSVAAELGRLYPENQEIYNKNAKKQISRINALDAELRVRLASLAGRPYIVLHDAFPYFERHYNVLAVGSLTLEPDAPASAKRLKDIRAKIQESGATCIFKEPQFDDRLLQTAAEGMPVRLGILDPIGAELEPGADLYFDLMEALATGLRDCLTAHS